jgi:pantoate--beta-alanine ligase
VLKDLLLAHPLPDNLHILPTTRDGQTGLALSSRNAYLSTSELEVAPVLHRALSAAKNLWEGGTSSGKDMVEVCQAVLDNEGARLRSSGSEVHLKVDYFEVFDRKTFLPVKGKLGRGTRLEELVIAGAIWVGKTRLIDNLLVGWDAQ